MQSDKKSVYDLETEVNWWLEPLRRVANVDDRLHREACFVIKLCR